MLCFASTPAITKGTSRTASEPYAFQVRITLSDKAAATLKRLNEGVVISASYSGDPKPSAKQHADQIGRIALGIQNVEIPGRPATVIVSGSHVKRGRVAWIRGPIFLNVNAYSARHSGPDNISELRLLRRTTARYGPAHGSDPLLFDCRKDGTEAPVVMPCGESVAPYRMPGFSRLS